LQFGEWWSGVALWFPLHPAFDTTLAEVRSHMAQRELYLGILSAVVYGILAWQLAFPLFAWRPRWRVVLLGGAVLGWIGTAFIYHQPLIGPALLVGCLSYVTPAEWHRLFGRLTGVPGLRQVASWPSGAVEPRAEGKQREGTASLAIVGQR
jgi:hypothetical protein